MLKCRIMGLVDDYGGIKSFIEDLTSHTIKGTPFERKALRCIVGCIDDAYCIDKPLEEMAVHHHITVKRGYHFLLSYDRTGTVPAINTALAILSVVCEYGKKLRVIAADR